MRIWVQRTESRFSKVSAVNGIPHYFLIDKHGRIISNNAARPSHKSIQNDLDAALN